MKDGLSDGEWKIMNRLWDKSPRTIMQLVSDLKDETNWTKHTIISMLSRMEEKGAVSYKQEGRAKAYYPLLKYDSVAIQETEGFLSKVYNGSVGLLMSNLIDSKSLTKSDIDELYEILRQAEEDGDDA